MNSKRKNFSETVLKIITIGAAIITMSVLFFIVIFILINGVPHIKPSLFSLQYNSENVSLMPALITTIGVTLLSLILAAPVSIFAAIWLCEYAKRGNKLVKLVRITAETLSGIPSIVYGLFGMLFFVSFLGFGYSLLAGAFTLSLMILPLILRSTEEALTAVPDAWREGAFGLGAGKLRTVIRIILPAAAPGIFAGLILAVGRVVGESAALIYTAGSVAQIPENLFASARTLSVHMYALSSEGLHVGEGYATAVILLVVVVLINTASAAVAKKIGRAK
jgi:phosphate transport system permease protein